MASISNYANSFLNEALATDLLLNILRDPSLLITEWRDLKLKLMLDTSDPQLIPNINRIKYNTDGIFRKKEKYWNTIEKYKASMIITGSLSLKAFGFIDREPGDIDFIIKDKSILENLKLRKYDKYSGMSADIDVLGYYTVYTQNIFGKVNGKWDVDFFESNTTNFIEKDGFLFHHPYEIMEKKVRLIQNRDTSSMTKDIRDFYNFRKIISSREKLN